MTNVILLSLGLELVNINSNIPKIEELWAFLTNCPGTKSSQTDLGQNLRKLTGDKSESQPSGSMWVDFLRVFQQPFKPSGKHV